MYQQAVTFTNELGMYARFGTRIIQTANSFKSTIIFEGNGRKVSGKSLMGTLSLAPKKGDEILVSANGPDEAEAVDAICSLIRQEGEAERAKKELQEKRRAEKKPGPLSRLIAMLCGRK